MAPTTSKRITHLVFLEDRSQVFWIKQELVFDSETKLIALTAEALQALEEYGLPHEPVSAYADTRKLASIDEQLNLDAFSLAQEIESFMAERFAPCRFNGPGFLSGQGYYLQYSISFVATRAYLMVETIRACSPDIVTAFHGEIDPWFLGDGYTRNPWLDVIEGLTGKYGYRLELLKSRGRRICSVSDNAQRSLQGVYRAGRKISRAARRFIGGDESQLGLAQHNQYHDMKDLRLLLVYSAKDDRDHLASIRRWLKTMVGDNGLGHDWAPVLAALRPVKGIRCDALDGAPLDTREWTFAFHPSIRNIWSGRRDEIEASSPQADLTEVQTMSELFDDWLSHRAVPPTLNVLGLELFPSLACHLRAMACLSPTLVRHSDAVAIRALEITRPHAVCLFAMPWLAAKRLAFVCRSRGVPVICYQHGGVYGTHISPKNEQIEPGHADYFLTYGTGIKPRVNPTFPVRARYVPVGSSRIASFAAKSPPSRNKRKAMKILWVAEFSTRNTNCSAVQVEDTERYLLQKRCLQILNGAEDIQLTYRPYVHQMSWEGTTRWLRRAKLNSVSINSSLPLEELIQRSDVVITDTSSGTVWNEVMALKKPLILYCDPAQTRLTPDFMTDLERACYWCKSTKELIDAVTRLSSDGKDFLAHLRMIDTTAFLRDYVLYREDQHSVERVVAFLNTISSNERLELKKT